MRGLGCVRLPLVLCLVLVCCYFSLRPSDPGVCNVPEGVRCPFTSCRSRDPRYVAVTVRRFVPPFSTEDSLLILNLLSPRPSSVLLGGSVHPQVLSLVDPQTPYPSDPVSSLPTYDSRVVITSPDPETDVCLRGLSRSSRRIMRHRVVGERFLRGLPSRDGSDSTQTRGSVRTTSFLQDPDPDLPSSSERSIPHGSHMGTSRRAEESRHVKVRRTFGPGSPLRRSRLKGPC